MSNKRIGILGGTFNPVHIGHLVMAETARQKLKLDEVIFVPSYLPPHKTSRGVVSAKARFEMVRLAIRGHKAFCISDFEIKRPKKSYSIETLTHFKNRYSKGRKLFFIIGEDSLAGLHKWKQIDEIVKIVSFVCLNRPDAKRVKTKYKVKLISMPGIDISSSYIRKSIAAKESVKYLLPQPVIEYIRKRRLYRA